MYCLWGVTSNMIVKKLDLDLIDYRSGVVQDIRERNVCIMMGKIFDSLYTDLDKYNKIKERIYN